MGGSFFFARNLVVGDVHPGTPMLWPDSRYNQDTDAIAKKFANTEELTVVVEGDSHDTTKRPEVLGNIEAFQRHMEQLDEVGATTSIADLLPGVVSLFHGEDPKFELIPDEREQSAFFLEMIFTAGQPGDLTRYITPDSKNANISLFLRDHKGETLRKVIAHAREFIDAHPMKGAKFRLAGGYGGLLAAINEEVATLDARITFAAFGAVFFCCFLAYRSLHWRPDVLAAADPLELHDLRADGRAAHRSRRERAAGGGAGRRPGCGLRPVRGGEHSGGLPPRPECGGRRAPWRDRGLARVCWSPA